MSNLFVKPKAADIGDLSEKFSQKSLIRSSSQRVKATKSSTLVIQVLEGADLAAKDSSGTSDPFVVINLNDTKVKTKVISKNLNPVWENEIFTFPIGGLDPLDTEIHFKVYDKDKFGTDYMGEFKVVLDEALNTPDPQPYVLVSSKASKQVSGTITIHFTSESQ